MTNSEIITSPLTGEDIGEIDYIELMFFAYRDFTADADRILETFGFGRAHHRVLYFVNRSPGLTVAELLDILGITKQSLARVLKQLMDSNYIKQKTGATDRRQRLLYPTPSGRELILELSRPQSRRIHNALKRSGLIDSNVASKFMIQLTNAGLKEEMADETTPDLKANISEQSKAGDGDDY